MAQNSTNYSTKVEDGKFCPSNKKKQDNSLFALLYLLNLFKVLVSLLIRVAQRNRKLSMYNITRTVDRQVGRV